MLLMVNFKPLFKIMPYFSIFYIMSAALILSPSAGLGDSSQPKTQRSTEFSPSLRSNDTFRQRLASGRAQPPDERGDYGAAASRICGRMALEDPGNHNRYFERPEGYELVNASCIEPAYSPWFRVYCRQYRRRGIRLRNGPITKKYGSCGRNEVCLDDIGKFDFMAPGGRWLDSVVCVPQERAQVQRVRREIEAKKWCSEQQLLAIPHSSNRASFKLTIESSSSSASQFAGAIFWFEIIADWWKFGHRLAQRTGRGSSLIVNTAPSLGNTYVKFCTIIPGDTISKILPWVGILYSKTLLKPDRRGVIHEDQDYTTPILDVIEEPSSD